MSGYYIKAICVRGAGMEPAEVGFDKGANLVTGGSDTGKSYIFAALNYGLGIGEQPKDIPQSVGYTEVLIEIETFLDNKTYTLWRQFGKSAIYVKECDHKSFYTKSIDWTKLTTYGQLSSPDHINSFLLKLCGLNEKKLLVNKNSGTTTNLTFRHLLNLTFIAEELIIKTTSPYYFSQQYKERIIAQSLLHVLLSGNDFSEIVEKEDLTLKENQLVGKLEFLDYQVRQFSEDKLILVEKVGSAEFVSEKQKFLDLDANLQQNIVAAKEIINRKNNLLQNRQNLMTDLSYKSELSRRFEILEKQYLSDSDRLDFILESHLLSEQLGDVVCPLCSSPLHEDHLLHIREKENFVEAAQNELIKIRSKLIGLQETAENLVSEKTGLQHEIQGLTDQLSDLETDLQTNFAPKITDLKTQLNQYLEVENISREITFIDNQISKLLKEKDRLERLLNAKKPEEEEINLVPYSILTDLCWYIEQRLQRWNYETAVKVDFDSNYNVFDILISGKNRRSYGKGKRSISYAACLIGLLDYCSSKKNNFTNIIVLDSPLTTFEEKQKLNNVSEIIQTEILKSFFHDIVNLPPNSQVIIFDNKRPDEETYELIKDKLNLTVFASNSDTERGGFFPD